MKPDKKDIIPVVSFLALSAAGGWSYIISGQIDPGQLPDMEVYQPVSGDVAALKRDMESLGVGVNEIQIKNLSPEVADFLGLAGKNQGIELDMSKFRYSASGSSDLGNILDKYNIFPDKPLMDWLNVNEVKEKLFLVALVLGLVGAGGFFIYVIVRALISTSMTDPL